MKLLITGFEPFGGEELNPSFEAIKTLSERHEKRLLPVSYKRAAKRLQEEIRSIQPDALLCVGQAGGRSAVTLERFALNAMYAELPDCDGECPHGSPVEKGAPCALETPFPVETLAARIDREIRCKPSYHAGTYVCNATYYTALRSGLPALFVHIPYCEHQLAGKPEQTPYLPLKDSARVLSLLTEWLEEEWTHFPHQ